MTTAQWEKMTANERNFHIGELIGAERLKQDYWYLKGEARAPSCTDGWPREKIEEAVAHHKMLEPEEFMKRAVRLLNSKENNDIFYASPPGDMLKKVVELQASLEIKPLEWHMRYSDTPGGGWDVIEAIRKKGFGIDISSNGELWEVTANWEEGEDNAPLDMVWCNGLTMADAACLVAIKVFKKEVKE